jgi:5-oxopent-3-ene-1,2,5-tricarboxylate decarboxylase/2-hydroxyhepta-2,4-diene-1,7-dioate isomerase
MLIARVSLPGQSGPVKVHAAKLGETPLLGGERIDLPHARWHKPTEGLVYGVILNDPASIEHYGERMVKAPHVKPPSTPVLYIKPYNTHVGHGALVTLPQGIDRVEIGACLGLVFGSSCACTNAEAAHESVAGYTIAIDLSIPVDDLYRPPIIEKCFDGACPMGPWVIDREDVPDPNNLMIRTFVNDALVAERRTSDMLRPVWMLVSEVCDFMTLHPGDVLLTGYPLRAPTAGPGDKIAVEIDGLGRLECRLAAHGSPVDGGAQ